MKVFSAFLLVVLFAGCREQPRVPKELLYSALNALIRHDSIPMNIVCGKFSRLFIPPEIRNGFLSDDTVFVQKQIRASNDLSIDTGRLCYCSHREGRFMHSHIDKDCTSGIVYRLSFPVFSRDLQTVIVGFAEDCHCMLGGWGYTAVFRQKNGNWVLVMKYDDWVS